MPKPWATSRSQAEAGSPIKEIIIAVDPGGTTGIATYRMWDQKFESAEVIGWEDALDVLATLTDSRMYAPPRGMAHIVCENFHITQRTAKLTAQPEALYMIGALMYRAHADGHEFRLQNPSDKQFAQDDKLKTVGWYRPGKGHANDAARHLLIYMVSRRLIDPDQFLAR